MLNLDSSMAGQQKKFTEKKGTKTCDIDKTVLMKKKIKSLDSLSSAYS